MLAPVLTFTAAAVNQLRISWSAVEGAISYTLQFRTSETEPWETLETTDETGYTHYNVGLNTIYYYRVSANSETDLVWSNATSAQLWYPTSCYVNKTAAAITVSWNALYGIDSWIVQRSTDNATWETLASDIEGTSYSDTTFEQNKWYYYRVIPNVPTGCPRQANGVCGVWKQTEFSATAVGSSSIRLDCPSPEGYTNNRIIQYTTEPDGYWMNLATIYSNTTSYTHNYLEPGLTYFYRIYCYDGNYAELYTFSEGITLPHSIDNLVAIRSGDSVLLSWDTVNQAEEYTISKSTDEINWTEYVETDTVFCDDSPVEGATNYYKVSTGIGEAFYSSPVVDITLIGIPETFTATPQSNGYVSLNWSSCYGANYYTLQRRTADSSEWTQIVTNYNRQYYSENIQLGPKYFYRVKAIGGQWKEIGPIWVPDISALAPVATALQNGTIRIEWTDLANTDKYDLLRSLYYNGIYEKIAAPTASSFIDTNVDPNTTYFYKVGFESMNMFSGYVSATAIQPEVGETILDFQAISTSELEIRWQPVVNAESYTIQYRTDPNAVWTTLLTTTENSFRHTSLSLNRDLYYRRSTNTASEISWSKQHRIRIAQTTSMNSSVNKDQIVINWSAVYDATEYIIERSEDRTNWTTLSNHAAGTSFIDTNIEHNTNYSYRVRPDLPGGLDRELAVIGYYLVDAPSATLNADRTVSVMFANPIEFTGNRILYRTTEPTWTNPTLIMSINSVMEQLTFIDQNPEPGALYYYWIQCGNAEPVRTNSVQIPKLLFGLTAFATEDKICLSWDSIESAEDYTIYRSSDQIHWTPFKTAQTSLIDTTFEVGVIYSYWVETTVDIVVYQSEIITAIVLGAVENLTATRGISGGGWGSSTTYYRFDLSWTPCIGATGYIVQYRTADSGEWITGNNGFSTGNGNVTSSINITRNTWYYIRVKPVGGPVWNEIGPIWYPNMTELYPDIEVTEEGFLRISWTPLPGASEYVILRSPDAYGTFTPVGITSHAYFIDYSATPNTRYYYKIGFPNDDLCTVYVTEVSGNYIAPPTGITLSHNTVLPQNPAGTIVGEFSTTSAFLNGTYQYTLTDGENSEDNSFFQIEGNTLKTAAVLEERSYNIRVRSSDETGLYIEIPFQINVTMPTLETPYLANRAAGYNSVQLYWGPVDHAELYRLEYKLESEPEWVILDLTDTYSYRVPYVINTLLPNENYQFRLKAFGTGYHDSEYSELNVTTLADGNPPIITLSSYDDLYIEPGGELVLPTATAFDAADGDLPVTCRFYDQNDVEIETIDTSTDSSYTVIWSATDHSGNTAQRAIHVFVTDKVPPEITITPYDETDSIHIVLTDINDYIEYGATAEDNCDGPVEVESWNNFEDRNGLYRVYYSASDSSGNTSSATRYVAVSTEEEPLLYLNATVENQFIRLLWNFRQEIPVILQRRIKDETDWTDLTDAIHYETWSDAFVADNTLYYYRLISTNGTVLSNTVPQFISDTTPPEITVHNYGTTGHIDVSLPVNTEYIEYGATATDIVDPDINLSIEGEVDPTEPGLYPVLYIAVDHTGHRSEALRYVHIYDDDTFAITEFKAVAISQSAIRLSWPDLNKLHVNVERREDNSSEYTIIATGITGGVYDDTIAQSGKVYYYRLTMPDGQPLTAEDRAWLIRVIHYSTAIQHVSISAIETTAKQKWSVVTQLAHTWSCAVSVM